MLTVEPGRRHRTAGGALDGQPDLPGEREAVVAVGLVEGDGGPDQSGDTAVRRRRGPGSDDGGYATGSLEGGPPVQVFEVNLYRRTNLIQPGLHD